MVRVVVVLLVIFNIVGCDSKKNQQSIEEPKALDVTKQPFGSVDGRPIEEFKLSNGSMSFSVINYGGIITAINVADREGQMDDIALGFDNIEGYLTDHPYFGALIGRYGNRIAMGKFSINDIEYNLPISNAPNSLHGGDKGFDKVVWAGKEIRREDAVGVEISGVSPDMDQGYPGNLSFKVNYWLTNENEIELEYEATTDKTTHCNLTNHSYFNLNGAGNGDILDHELFIAADYLTPVDATLIPTGDMMPVINTAFDFNIATKIGLRIANDEPQIKFGNGYDHNYVVKRIGQELEKIAEVSSAKSGRKIEVWTTEPGVQLYTGNFLDGSIVGKSGKTYGFRSGFCLETQHYPDTPNQPNFPSTILQPGEVYRSTTVYKFGIIE